MTSLFEAVVFRFVPDEGSGEALNVGLALRTEAGEFFKAELADKAWKRISDAFPDTHAATIRTSFMRVRNALEKLDGKRCIPGITNLDKELRQIVPSPDGFLKWSETIEGETEDANATFRRLMYRYVEQNLQDKPERVSRKDEDVRATFEQALAKRTKLRTRVVPRKLVAKDLKGFEVEVQHAWKNGRWNCVQPVSLDMVNVRDINSKAAQVVGSVQLVSPSEQDAHMILLVGIPPSGRKEAHDAAQEAIEGVRRHVKSEAEVYLEEDAEKLLDQIEADLAAHPHH